MVLRTRTLAACGRSKSIKGMGFSRVLMKSVAVKLLSAKVAKYNARDEHLELQILLHDGKDKALVKQLHIENPSQQAEDIFKEIRDKLKKAHSGSSFGDDPLSGLVHIRWLQDEEVVHERLARFLAALNEKIRNAKRKNISYYDLERQMLTARTSFD